MASKLGLRTKDEDIPLKCNTRVLYAHFDRKSFTPLSELLGPNKDLPLRMGAGSGHHCFDGGWLWEIPFDDGA